MFVFFEVWTVLRVIIIVNCYYKKLFFKCTQLSAVGGYLTLWKKKNSAYSLPCTSYYVYFFLQRTGWPLSTTIVWRSTDISFLINPGHRPWIESLMAMTFSTSWTGGWVCSFSSGGGRPHLGQLLWMGLKTKDRVTETWTSLRLVLMTCDSIWRKVKGVRLDMGLDVKKTQDLTRVKTWWMTWFFFQFASQIYIRRESSKCFQIMMK